MDTSNNPPNNPRVGFSETLKQMSSNPPVQNINNRICEDIFDKGKNVNKKFFFPSEFPKITKIKSNANTSTNKKSLKGGKRHARKSRKYRHKSIVKL